MQRSSLGETGASLVGCRRRTISELQEIARAAGALYGKAERVHVA